MRSAWLLGNGSSFWGGNVESELGRIKPSCLPGLAFQSGELPVQLIVVLRLLGSVQQTNSRRGNLIEDFLGEGRVLARLERPDVRHPLVGGTRNHVGIVLEYVNPKQTVMIWRLILGGNAEPFVVGVEGFGHGLFLSIN